MAVSSLFSKLKALTPVGVVGLAVVVTIKLLTTTTPTVEEDLSVDAKEDISLTQYEDKIELPPPPPEPEAPEKKEEKEEEKEKGDEEEEMEEKETEEAGEETEEEAQEEDAPPKEEKKEQQEKPKTSRTWISDPSNTVATLLKGLLTQKGEK